MKKAAVPINDQWPFHAKVVEALNKRKLTRGSFAALMAEKAGVNYNTAYRTISSHLEGSFPRTKYVERVAATLGISYDALCKAYEAERHNRFSGAAPKKSGRPLKRIPRSASRPFHKLVADTMDARKMTIREYAEAIVKQNKGKKLPTVRALIYTYLHQDAFPKPSYIKLAASALELSETVLQAAYDEERQKRQAEKPPIRGTRLKRTAVSGAALLSPQETKLLKAFSKVVPGLQPHVVQFIRQVANYSG